MKYFLIFIQLIGGVNLYFWFFNASNFFFLLKKHKNSNPILMFFFQFGFIIFPAVLGICYHFSWEFFEENNIYKALGLSLIPILVFLLGLMNFKYLEKKNG